MLKNSEWFFLVEVNPNAKPSFQELLLKGKVKPRNKPTFQETGMQQDLKLGCKWNPNAIPSFQESIQETPRKLKEIRNTGKTRRQN